MLIYALNLWLDTMNHPLGGGGTKCPEMRLVYAYARVCPCARLRSHVKMILMSIVP